MNKNIWELNSMKVLVTGAAGFLGSHLTEKLIESGYSVRALMHYDSNNNWGWLENSKYRKEIDFVVVDDSWGGEWEGWREDGFRFIYVYNVRKGDIEFL